MSRKSRAQPARRKKNSVIDSSANLFGSVNVRRLPPAKQPDQHDIVQLRDLCLANPEFEVGRPRPRVEVPFVARCEAWWRRTAILSAAQYSSQRTFSFTDLR